VPPSGYSTSMFAAENIRDWIGRDVIDPAGDTIGDLESVYVDTTSDQPSFFTVVVGVLGRKRLAFVPAGGATVTPKAVRVQYAKSLVKEAPAIDRDGELLAADEPAVFEHYGIAYTSRGERLLARR
jgi:hypothetical protein